MTGSSTSLQPSAEWTLPGRSAHLACHCAKTEGIVEFTGSFETTYWIVLAAALQLWF
jgi:hypothetical protein